MADESQQWLYISNINGAPTELNGKGYISRISPDGTGLQQHWLEGLDAPKGLAIKGDRLYIADMQTLHVASLSKGSIEQSYKLEQAVMLNDITVSDEGSVYVSDLLGGGVYRLQDNQLQEWLSPEIMPHPNGLLWQNQQLLIASWGTGLNNDFSTDVPGSLYRIDPQTRQFSLLAESYQLGNLDGLISRGDDYYISDWISGDLYQVGDNQRKRVLKATPGLADIGTANGVIYAPMMLDNQLVAWQLPE